MIKFFFWFAGGLKVKSNKKQRPRSATAAGQKQQPSLGYEDEEGNDENDHIHGDFMKNFNDVVCQSMYQVIDPHAEAELPSSSQMEMEDVRKNAKKWS